MDDARFDRLSRLLSVSPSRRAASRVLAGLLTGGAIGHLGRAETWAKNKKKQLKRNPFGCVKVGSKCRGKDAVCCSGICQGQKPKKGKPDRSHCAAHDVSSCVPGQSGCTGEFFNCTTSTGIGGGCFTTTGNAGYCSASGVSCIPCTKDAQCVSACGAGAACVHCADTCPGPATTFCAGLEECVA